MRKKGFKHSPETRAKISKAGKGRKVSPESIAKWKAANKGRKLSAEHRAKIAESGRGRSPSAETRVKMSEASKKRWESPEYREKVTGWKHSPEACARNLARRNTQEFKEKMSRALCSPEVSAKIVAANKRRVFSEETRAKMSASGKRKTCLLEWTDNMRQFHQGRELTEEHRAKLRAWVRTPEFRAKVSANMMRLYQNAEYCEMYRKAMGMKPNKPETFLLGLLDQMYPGEWRYTGDFSFTINGKSPDFVNCNGQKKIIELFGDYWHQGECPADRAAVFAPFGYQTLVIWERELKDVKRVVGRITEFNAL